LAGEERLAGKKRLAALDAIVGWWHGGRFSPSWSEAEALWLTQFAWRDIPTNRARHGTGRLAEKMTPLRAQTWYAAVRVERQHCGLRISDLACLPAAAGRDLGMTIGD
jgi:hypothetical protein